MKRILLTMLAACALVAGTAVAQAEQTGGSQLPARPSAQAVVSGTITSVTQPTGGTHGAFAANAYVVTWHGYGPGSTPTTTSETISLGANTKIDVRGVEPGPATVSDLAPLQRFFAVYDASPGESLANIVAGTPVSVYAYLPTVCVAGTITSVDATKGTFDANAVVLPSWWCGDRHHDWHGQGPVVPGGSGSNGDNQNPGSPSGNSGSGWTGAGSGNATPGSGWAGAGPGNGAPGSGWTGAGSGNSGNGTGGGWADPQSHKPNTRVIGTSVRSHDASWTPPTPPAPTSVTISTNPSTTFWVNHASGTIGDLGPTQHFVAVLPGTPGEPLATLTGNDALHVFARGPVPAPPVVVAINTPYLFVGTVTGTTRATTTTGGTVTVKLTYTEPTALSTGVTTPQTFTLSTSTQVLQAGSAGLSTSSLANVGIRDMVAGGAIGAAGLNLGQFGTTPLQVLIDIPPSSSATVSADKALAKVSKLLKKERRQHARRARHNRHLRRAQHLRRSRRRSKRS